jgi:hypothetical protein
VKCLALALVLGLGLACGGSPLPGAMLGTYKVVGQSKKNSCGLGAPDPWTFDAELSLQGSTLYWSWMDGSPLLSGSLGSQGHATLTRTGTVNADSTDAGLGPCNLERSDALDLVLGDGNASFGGTIGYSFAVANGATCTDQLVSSGGMFRALPCTVQYTVSGTRQ